MDRNQTRAQSERQKNRDRFLELEQGLSSDFIIIEEKKNFLFSYRK
jgi:hypothetical protein